MTGMIAESTVNVFGPEQPALPADGPELPALVNYIRNGRCALFVGSGFSAPAGLPTWSGLMRQLIGEAIPWAIDAQLVPPDVSLPDDPVLVHEAEEVKVVRSALGEARFQQLCRLVRRFDPKAGTALEVAQAMEVVRRDSLARRELERLMEQKRFPELAGHCRESLGRDRFQTLVQRALQPTQTLPATHADMVKIPFACVVTTNFDRLIEEAYTRWDDRGVPRAPTGSELAEHGTLLLDRAFFVLKAHGDLLRPETMIFTADDYRRVIHANPAFQAVLSGILLTHAVLFVGYSLSDTNFRLLLDNQLTVFNGNVPPRFALLDGVESAERDILWRTAKLRTLAYPRGQHQEVGRFLQALAAHFAPERAVKGQKLLVTTAAAAIPYCTLRIDRAGGGLALDLVRHSVDGKAERLWVGGGALPSWTRVTKLMALAAQASQPGAGDLANLAGMGQLLTRAVPAALRRKLRSLPPGQTLELDCSPETDCLPWEWLQSGGEPICLQRPLIRRPVEISNTARGFRFARPPLRFLIIGDAGMGEPRCNEDYPLAGAEREAAAIVRQVRSASRRHHITRLSREQATRERFLQTLAEGDFDVIHFGGHAWFGAYESHLYFWDGAILGAEITPLLSRRPPALLVLNTHFTAFRPYGVIQRDFTDLVRAEATGDAREPEGARGFTTLAMHCGITSFVGSFGSVGDESAADLIVAFYAALLRGQTVAEALHTARRQTVRKDPATPLFYTVSGHPEFRLVHRAPKSRRSLREQNPRRKSPR